MTSSEIEVRLTALRDDMRRIMRAAATLMAAKGAGVRADGKTDLSSPISLAGFSRHFTFKAGNETRHCVYGYATAAPDPTVDRQAQLDLLALTRRIGAVNEACRGRSGLALQHLRQDAEIRSALDFIIARAAFFAAFFDNMLMAQPALTGTPVERARGIDLVRMRRNLDDWTARANGMMSEPARQADYVPDIAWPIVGGEIEVEDLPGQIVVDEIYLPPDMAGPLLERLVDLQNVLLTGRS